jgi:hypothetical protein
MKWKHILMVVIGDRCLHTDHTLKSGRGILTLY